jgi:hypothetical protein
MTAQATFKQFWRVRSESAFDAASPAGGAEWNIGGNGGGANGWMDLPVVRESDGLQPKTAVIYPSTASGSRAMNAALPLAGADLLELGNLEFAIYPELGDRILRAVMGGVSRAETAGVAAKSSVAFASLATLDTQPDGTEQLKFTIASSTAASAAKINIIQSAATLETIDIGTSGATVDGDYYSKGGYDGSTNAITFTIEGTVTAGMVVVAGVNFSTNTFTAGATNPTLVIEQGGRPEAGATNSEYFPGVVVPTLVLNYDRSAPDNLLMANATMHGVRPDTATAGTYQDDAATYYRPIAGWNGALTIGAVATTEMVAASITLQNNNQLYAVSSGNQQPTGQVEGELETFGELTALPGDDTLWIAYRNQTVYDVEITFTTPFFVVDTTGYQVKFEFTQLTFGDYTRNQQGSALGATIPFRAIYNSTDSGPCKITTICRMPV